MTLRYLTEPLSSCSPSEFGVRYFYKKAERESNRLNSMFLVSVKLPKSSFSLLTIALTFTLLLHSRFEFFMIKLKIFSLGWLSIICSVSLLDSWNLGVAFY